MHLNIDCILQAFIKWIQGFHKHKRLQGTCKFIGLPEDLGSIPATDSYIVAWVTIEKDGPLSMDPLPRGKERRGPL